jgi:hypothetical protein
MKSQFAVLWRAFFAQFFTSESATSDVLVPQAMIGAITFLLPPGIFLLVAVFPEYENIVQFRPRQIDEARMRIAMVLIGYAMVTIGFVAVFVWEGLTFERRDAMVIGPLPLRDSTIINAKLAALGVLLGCAAAAINVLTALPFASVTANHLGLASFVRDTAALLSATVGGATFVFASLVSTRALVMLLGSPRIAARLGSFFQFTFVTAMLCFIMLTPRLLSTSRAAFLEDAAGNFNPHAWFLGLFEHLHGSSEAAFALLAQRAIIALVIALIAGVALSIVSVHHQLQRALVPVASAGSLGRAVISRTVARWCVGRDPIAQATSEFIVLTIARNRPQQAPIAIAAAIGLAFVIAGLSRTAIRFDGTMAPTSAVLWVPLVLAYWMAMGLRAAFFVPSELPAAWSFRANAPAISSSFWFAARAAMIGLLLPPIVALSALLAVLVGWRVAAWHTLVVALLTVLLVQVVMLTFAQIPFTRSYEPGQMKLRLRWPIYMVACYAFAYGPLRFELRMLTPPRAGSLLMMAAWLAVAIVVLHAIGRRKARTWTVDAPEMMAPDFERLSVLDLGQSPARARLISNGEAQ